MSQTQLGRVALAEPQDFGLIATHVHHGGGLKRAGAGVYHLDGRVDEFGSAVPLVKLTVGCEAHEDLWDGHKLWWVDDPSDVEIRDGQECVATYLVLA